MKTNNNNIFVNAQSNTHPNPTELIKTINRKKKFKTLREKKTRYIKTLRYTKITFTTGS